MADQFDGQISIGRPQDQRIPLVHPGGLNHLCGAGGCGRFQRYRWLGRAIVKRRVEEVPTTGDSTPLAIRENQPVVVLPIGQQSSECHRMIPCLADARTTGGAIGHFQFQHRRLVREGLPGHVHCRAVHPVNERTKIRLGKDRLGSRFRKQALPSLVVRQQLRRGHGATEQAHFVQGTAQTEVLIVVLIRPDDHGSRRGIQNGTRLIATGRHHRAIDHQTHLGPIIDSGHMIPPVGLECRWSSQEGELLATLGGEGEREFGFDESQHPTALKVAIVLHLADEPTPRGNAVDADPGFSRHIALGQQRPIRRIGHHDALIAARKLDPRRTRVLHQSGFAHEGQLLADGRSHARVLCPLRGEDPAPNAAGFLGTQTQCGGK